MDNDPQTTTSCKGEQDQERQDRRQFFNGLGKWSLAIIAAVTALRDGLHDVESGIGSRLDAPPAGRGEPRQQIAKKKGPHIDDVWHTDQKHINTLHGDHADTARQAPGGGTTPSGPGGSQDKIE